MHSWMQYHGNSANQGLMPVHTSVATKPKWMVEVGEVGHGSPVIGSDGVIYVGLLSGELVAVNPDGSIKWKRAVTADFPGVVTGSPAVGMDGNIYLITTVDTIIKDRRNESSSMIQVRRSTLHSFTPAGNRRWSYRFPSHKSASGLGAYTTSSPKVWGHHNIFVFVPAIYAEDTNKIEILVIHHSGNVVNKTEVIRDAASGEPSLAMIDSNHEPILVILDNDKTLKAYRWNFPVLKQLWSHELDKACFRTSPVVFANNEILFGDQTGMLNCYDLKSGRKKHEPWFQADDQVITSPVFFENKIYFVAGQELMMLSADFEIEERYMLSDKCVGSLALSANHIYVPTSDGFYTFSLDLKKVHKNNDITGGVSTPAISRDGVVYIVNQDGSLFAFFP